MSLKSLNTKRGGDRPAQENVAIQVAQYHIEVKGKATPDKDYVEGYLLHDALGLNADFDTNGAPTTLVKAKLRPVENKNPKFSRPEILDISRGAGKSKAVKAGGVVVFEGSFLDRDGFVNGRWPRPAIYDAETSLEHIFPGMFASVHPERQPKEGKAGNSYQYRFIADVTGAVQFKTVDEFRTAAEAALQAQVGTPGFILRAADAAEKVFVSFRWMRTGSKKDGSDQWTFDEPAAVVKAFEEKHPEWISAIAENQGAIWEVIPVARFGTGKLSLPSAKEHGGDDSDNYSVKDGEDTVSAYTTSHLVIRRIAADGENWFGTSALPTSKRPALYLEAELPTANLTPELTEHLAKVAGARKTVRASNAASADDAHFGEPDASAEAAGLNP